MPVAVASVLLSPLVSVILGDLNTLAVGEFATAWGFKTELKNLESTLSTVQAVLQDAEEQQWKSEAIKNWLRKLKDAAYDAEDVIGDLTIEAQRRRQKREMKNRVSSFISSDHPLIFRVKMARKLKNIREKLDVIASEKSKFHLKGTGDTEANSFGWRLTSSLVNESEIYGREKEKEEFVGLLLNNSDNLSVYAICGMGGIGKTTLAQLIYNDESVEDHFDLRIWVCVSDDADKTRLTRAMIESIEASPCTIQELDPLQRHLQQKLISKKFLLVLDDVWDNFHDKWNGLKDALRWGAKGSCIMVTTRIEIVALKMSPKFVLHMEKFSDHDSWLLFEQLAFETRRKEEHAHLETIGKAIVKKCGGIPLAIVALGYMMRLKKNESEWLSVKESEIWNLGEEEGRILPALRLSFNNLPPYLKPCFSFCSIFPKDHVMERDQLVSLWMANGFISHKGQMDLHDIGHEIFDELVGRSFFQDIKDDGWGNVTCKMHDLIHDLAQSIMIDECCLIEANKKLEIPKTVRHLASYDRLSPPNAEDVLEVKSLRSLLWFDSYGSSSHWRNTLSSLCSRQKHLRILNVSGFILAKLSKSLGDLKHLRYLDLSHCFIGTLPESITCLQNLQTLNLRNCSSLIMLPKGMKHMKSLVYLDNTRCDFLRCMPAGMGQLTCLRKLTMFIVGKDDGHHIGELQGLNLGGELSIKGLDNVTSSTDAKSSNLIRKRNLQSLSLCWSPIAWWQTNERSSSIEEKSEEVLCGLHPHSNLKKLSISEYKGLKFPSWMMDLLLPNLVKISLEWCRSCKHLPPFGKLQFLKDLRLLGMSAVKYIGSDVYGDGEIPFPSLESLTIDGMRRLEVWATVAGRKSFPRLGELALVSCGKLVEMPIIPSVKTLKIEKSCIWSLMDGRESFPGLRKLTVCGCPMLVELAPAFYSDALLEMTNSTIISLRSVMNFSSLSSLLIQDFEELTFLPDGLLRNHTVLESLEIVGLKRLQSLSNQLGNLSALKTLNIWSCHELESLPEDLRNLNSLETLSIHACSKLNSLPVTGLCGLSSLRKLSIEHCDKFTSLSEGLRYLTALEDLYLRECPELNSLPESIQHLNSLRSLRIHGCKGLSFVPNQIQYLTCLSILVIRTCTKLLSLPDGVQSLNMLRYLSITDCPNLERRCAKERGEDWPKIAHIPTIFISGELIQSLET